MLPRAYGQSQLFLQSSPFHRICLEDFLRWHLHALSKDSKLYVNVNFIQTNLNLWLTKRMTGNSVPSNLKE